MESFKKRWSIFLGILFDPWTLCFLIATGFLLYKSLVHVHGIFPFESNPGERRSRMAKIGRNTFYEERERRFCI
jgi:hypothetical protein